MEPGREPLKESSKSSGSVQQLHSLLQPHESYCCFCVRVMMKAEPGQAYRQAFTTHVWTPLYIMLNAQHALDNYNPREFQEHGLQEGWDQVQAVILRSKNWYARFMACKHDGTTAQNEGIWLVEKDIVRPKLVKIHDLLWDILAQGTKNKSMGVCGAGKREAQLQKEPDGTISIKYL